jgi:hypothetical protein
MRFLAQVLYSKTHIVIRPLTQLETASLNRAGAGTAKKIPRLTTNSIMAAPAPPLSPPDFSQLLA